MDFLVDYNIESLADTLAAAGEKRVHAGRILRQYYESNGQIDWTAISVSRAAQRFVENLGGRRSQIGFRHEAADGTIKLLLDFVGGGMTETVLMPAYRNEFAAGCVSSQIGCAMGCDFCASTQNGLERDLLSGEIVEQFLHLKTEAAAQNRRLKTLVFMGMGEPLLNFENVTAAIERIADPDIGGLGWRQVTVSTVGIVPGIDRLADLDWNIHLALSLHAPDDATRSRLVPSNRRYPVAEVMDAAKRFLEKTGRTPNIEYCLIQNVNDSIEQALLLAELMRGFRAHVNVIPYNAIGAARSGKVYERPSRECLNQFVDTLRNNGVVCHVREARGDDVNAACGQLRRRLMVVS